MKRIDLARLFNKNADEFMTTLKHRYPEEEEFRFFHDSLGHVARHTPREPIDKFYGIVAVPYGARLLAREETFFLQADFSEDLGGKTWDDIIMKLRLYWRDMSAESRGVIWDYLSVFVRLAQRYADTPE